MSNFQGIKIWKNKKNKFVVFQLHYEANPDKRSKEFKEAIKSAMPRSQYMREYELNWDSYEGTPVYPDFDKKIHVAEYHRDPWCGLPLLRGWDFGLTPACVLAQLQEECLVVIKEWTAVNMGAERFSDKVLSDFNAHYPTYSNPKNCMDFIDPSGFGRVDTDESSCAQVLARRGLNIQPGAIAFEERKGSVEHFLTRRNRDGMCFQISSECKLLIRGFDGGYRYSERTDLSGKLKPVKDEHSHAHDALQMITSKIIPMMKKRITKDIPEMSYSWNKVK